MPAKRKTPLHVGLSVRIQSLTGDVEKLVPEVRQALEAGDPAARFLVASASKSLERAAVAVRALTQGIRDPTLDAVPGAATLISLLGSRVVLSGRKGVKPSPPSAGAQALAMLLEDPARSLNATEVAARVGCSVPIARTTLNRLVESGHAVRRGPGQFRAKAR